MAVGGFIFARQLMFDENQPLEKRVGQASNLGPVGRRLWCPPWPTFVVLCDGPQEDAGDLLETHQRHPSPASLVHTSPTGRQGHLQQHKQLCVVELRRVKRTQREDRIRE